MKRTLTLFLLAGMSFLAAFSQINDDQPSKKWENFIEVESGLIYPEGTIKESVAIRQNISSFYVNQYSSGYVSAQTSGFLAGIKYGYFFPAIKSGVSAGIRFTGMSTEISGYTSDISDFFYLRYSMEGSETRFARVKSMAESTYFITVPLDIMIVPVHYKNVSMYLKAGFEYSLLNTGSSADIVFQDEAMDANKASILSSITSPVNKNYSTFNSAIGFKFGQGDRPYVMLEIYLPSVFLTQDNFALIDIEYYEGVKLMVQIPLNNI